MAIDAKLIKALREKSGMGITDCKNALVEADGNFDDAELLLRKRQDKKAQGKTDRPTGEGIIVSRIDGNTAVLVEVACEQEPTTKNERFLAFVDTVIDTALSSGAVNPEELLAVSVGGETVQDKLTILIGTVGENVQLKNVARVEAPAGGIIGSYVHFNKKAGAVCALKLDGADAGNADLKTCANDVCMHSVAARPIAMNREGISDEIIAREKEVFTEAVKDKPANIQEKILEGKLKKFYGEKVLLEQVFVKDPDGKLVIGEVISNTAKAAGGTAELVAFTRMELGL